MTQRVATLELYLLQRLVDNRWFFAVKEPDNAFEQSMQTLSSTSLSIRKVTFTLGSGFHAMGCGWDVNETVMHMLSFQFVNWQEMHDQASRTRIFTSPNESFWTIRRQQKTIQPRSDQAAPQDSQQDTINVEITAPELSVLLEAINTYTPLLTAKLFSLPGIQKMVILNQFLQKIQPMIFQQARMERETQQRRPSAFTDWLEKELMDRLR